ncbi:AlpA family transcriptional regulator [Streptomyces sp. WAC07149]|uniref:helix-turn-helix transcriptional regulator n=1 Tax=Streptomyces sp. WAC07149 TaxID=2487425 RepID=UPI0021AFE86F|nr:helix-turn-helix domain-containing protein [Streptomyces sp. WAC07149]
MSVVDPIPSAGAAEFRHRSNVGRAFLGVQDTAEYLGISPKTLYVWRHRRQGPPSFRMGARGRVTYRVDALDAWIRARRSRRTPAPTPTSTPGVPHRSGALPTRQPSDGFRSTVPNP